MSGEGFRRRRVFPVEETALVRSLHSQSIFAQTRESGATLAVIVLGEVPFFDEGANEIDKAEIARFFARYCEGACSMDPVAVPERALDEMSRWTGAEERGTGFFGFSVPDWSIALRRWIESGPSYATRPRELAGLRKAMQLLSGAPFDVGTKVRSLEGRGWGGSNGRLGVVRGVPGGSLGYYEVRIGSGDNATIHVSEVDMQRVQ